MSDTHLTNQLFSDFDLPAKLRQGIEDAGFSRCTPIQAETLPLALKGQDIAGQAQTGTGKTAAFLIAMINKLLKNTPIQNGETIHPRALIMAPTRELAIQIYQDAIGLAKHTPLKIGVVYGGTGYDAQREMLKEGLDVLIGTPGRIIDYFKQHIFNLKYIEVLILDEADRMFDLGFIKDIRFVLRRMPSPEKRLNMLFSATLSHRVLELSYEHMNNPQLVRIESDRIAADNVKQVVYYTSNDEKIPLLLGLLKRMDPKRTIIFVNTKHQSQRVWSYLEGNGFKANILSGDVPQNKRQKLLKAFQTGELPILVATDVAARGLHITDVSHVFNYDLPQDAEDYVHRIGRTARAGASGDAISFACEDSAFALPDIEAYIEHKIPTEHIHNDLLVDPLPPAKIKTKRSGKPDRKGQRTDKKNAGRHRKKQPHKRSTTG